MEQKILYTNHVETAVDNLVAKIKPASVFVLVDHNTADRVLPRLLSICSSLSQAEVIRIKSGDENKNLDSLSYIWKELSNRGATRHTLLINLGGGVITDIGAFAASTFKRGITFINMPTTLLAAVDAAIGGKTGINFNGLKNEIGTFREADCVIISTTFFNTLPPEEIKSGYAEMLKHAMISDAAAFDDLIRQNVETLDPDKLLKLVEESTRIKKNIVEKDPFEKNLRKALNFGHTVGHAFESLAMERNAPIPHGYAVAYGMVVETILSVIKKRFPAPVMEKLSSYVFDNYRAFSFKGSDYDKLVEIMKHDKKNTRHGSINFTLLKNPGDIAIDCNVTDEELHAALDIYREKYMK